MVYWHSPECDTG